MLDLIPLAGSPPVRRSIPGFSRLLTGLFALLSAILLLGGMPLFGDGFSPYLVAVGVVMLVTVVISRYAVHRAERQRAVVERELAKREGQYRDLFDYSQSIISTHDLDGKLLSANKTLLDSLGYGPEDVIGKPFDEYVAEKYRAEYPVYLRKIANEGEAKGLVSMVTRDGRTLVWQYHNILISEPGSDPYVLGSALDVTSLMKIQNQLERTSLTDELTGLYNRRGFLTLAEQQIKLEGHSSTARGLTVIFADMDGLKEINDTLGHEVGSEAIQTVAGIVKSVVRSGDLVARWGGDEFLVLSIGAGDKHIQMISDRIENALDAYNQTSGKPYKVACSIGVAAVKLDKGKTFEEIIAQADEAMYEEKKRRKASRVLATPQSPSDSSLMPDSLAWY